MPMDPSSRSLQRPCGHPLDALVALMQDNPEIRHDLLAAASRDEIQATLRHFGWPTDGPLGRLDPEQLRDAFRCG